MNWKFWTWPAQIRGVHRTNAILSRELLRRKSSIPGLPSEEERAAAYLLAPENRLFLAVLADLREFAVEVSDRALDPELSDAKLRWYTGGSDALLEFLEKLQQRERDARLTAEQLAARQEEERETV